MALISDSLLEETADGLRLVGGRSRATGETVFPLPTGTEAAHYDKVLLKSEGSLWSYTVQRFPPKSPPFLGVADPARFQPFAVGYVELEDEVIVETRIETDDFSSLKLGMAMTLTTTEFEAGAGGPPIRTFAFRPQ
jgi:uncharacterized OB-fold protein